MGAIFGALGLKGILYIILACAIGFMVWDYTHAKAEVKRLNQQVTQDAKDLAEKETTINGLVDTNDKQAKKCTVTIDALNKRIGFEQSRKKQLEKLEDEIKQAPTNDDGDVAPVLKRTLNSLRQQQ